MSYWYRDRNVLNTTFLDSSFLNCLTHVIVNPEGPHSAETGGVQRLKFQAMRLRNLCHIVLKLL